MRKSQEIGRSVVSVALACAFMACPVALVGCNDDAGEQGAVATTGEQPAEEQPAEEQPVEEVQSEYDVTIDGATVTTDYEGAPAMIVDYSFTNNSDEATSFAVACSQKAFQNGVQLETAIVTEDLGNGYLAEIKPGATTTARMAYSLTDQSDVTVEVSELISLDDTLLAQATFPAA